MNVELAKIFDEEMKNFQKDLDAVKENKRMQKLPEIFFYSGNSVEEVEKKIENKKVSQHFKSFFIKNF